MNNRAIHYGWYIVAAGTLCIFASIGMGRFAIGMLLPAMGESLSLTYSQMGLISTGNFVGYLVAVLFCGFFNKKLGSRRLIFLALLVTGISMFLIGRAGGFATILLLYIVTGMGSGAANVPMMTLTASWFGSSKRGKATGFVVIGSGFAILLAGKLVPFLNRFGGIHGWRLSWQVLGAMVLGVAFICLLVLRNDPREKGLEPLGRRDPADLNKDAPHLPEKEAPLRRQDIFHMGAIYFLFGYTYVIYATFIVTTLIQERGFSEATAGNFWAWVGFLSLFSGPIFGSLSDRVGRKASLVTVFFIQAIAYLLVALKLPPAFLYLSIGCYGIVAWSIPSIMSALVGDLAGPRRATGVFGFITFIFAMGQIAGPGIAGVLAEKTGSFSTSFLMAAIFALAAVVLTSLLPKPAGKRG